MLVASTTTVISCHADKRGKRCNQMEDETIANKRYAHAGERYLKSEDTPNDAGEHPPPSANAKKDEQKPDPPSGKEECKNGDSYLPDPSPSSQEVKEEVGSIGIKKKEESDEKIRIRQASTEEIDPDVALSSSEFKTGDVASNDTILEGDAAAPTNTVPIKIEQVKTEPQVYFSVVKKHRKYHDRVLLSRQSPKGMMRMGGGNCTMELFPKKEDHPRFEAIGHGQAMAYSANWQPKGPRYAGAPGGIVSCAPVFGEPFSVFMKRQTPTGIMLGWEYCGEYQTAPEDEVIASYERACDMDPVCKRNILQDIASSLQRANGLWRFQVDRWKKCFDKCLQRDGSPAAPTWMIENRSPTAEEREQPTPPLAARLRALKYESNASDDKISQTMVEIDEFHEGIIVTFVRYNEKNLQLRQRWRNFP